MSEIFTPVVNPEAEFLEICNDFTEPREIVREAISNAFDAGAQTIKIGVHIDRTTGIDELVLNFQDDGHGMDVVGMQAFFSLAVTTNSQPTLAASKHPLQLGRRDNQSAIFHCSEFYSATVEVNLGAMKP